MQTILLTDWLAACQPETPIHRLFIPGTHDTMTASCQQRYYKTQMLSLAEQLQIGVRFFDLRLRKEMVAAHREWISNISAKDIFDSLIYFLKQHPKEFVFIRVQNANEQKDDFDQYKLALWSVIEQYQEYFYHWKVDDQSFTFPCLSAVAGKIVALECSPPTMQTYWLNQQQWALPWHNNTKIVLQDDWNAPVVTDKFNAIRQNVSSSAVEPEKLFLNHISATNGELGYPDAYAEILNPQTLQLWQEMEKQNICGVQIYDFITEEIATAVIKHNFCR
ncbi:phosphatidylinositol-specific phospholipase C domain-containing protein [Gallibacterium melopsittaci]|uniref:1-phosphatidylinositol phosphodiesterase n=1 Tax=Gallibacterium melopsittaci TaxID=516063 RepID=A0ABV6HVP8_9PAST